MSRLVKTCGVIISVIFCNVSLYAQEFAVTLSGGVAVSNPNGYRENAAGYRINGIYEINREGSKVAQGLSVGYISTTYEEGEASDKTKYTIRTWPIYYTYKLMLGKSEKFKPFIRGGLGMHFPKYKASGLINFEKGDLGFFGGAAIGGMIAIKENMFINVEYEFAYLSNSYFDNGIINSAQVGLGFKF